MGYITVKNTVAGNIGNIQVLGNTVQNIDNLADIKSCGIERQDGKYEMSILSCGKNRIDASIEFVRGNLLQGNTDPTRAHLNSTIKVAKNTDHYITVPSGYLAIVSAVNKDNVQIVELYPTYSGSKLFNTKEYDLVSVQVKKSDNSTIDLTDLNSKKFQLEEGAVATSYEPYQSTKNTISLPCALGKGDRLYYDEVEKAWCIEKVETDKTLNGDFGWNISLAEANTIRVQGEPVLDIKDPNNTEVKCISNLFKSMSANALWNADEEGISVNTSSRIVFRISKSKASSLTEIKKYITENLFNIKYQSTTPTKIILPLDVQIQLNSFLGTTHAWIEAGEVDGTLKVTVPKSIGASVQSAHEEIKKHDDRISAIEGLKESQNMVYESNNGHIVAKATQNGVVKDIKLQGRTLVNLCSYNYTKESDNVVEVHGEFTFSGKGVWAGVVFENISMIKPNTTYTLITEVVSNTLNNSFYASIKNARNPFMQDVSIATGFTGISVAKLTTSEITTQRGLVSQVSANSTSGSLKCRFLLLEGDHTQNPPSYFEGMQSVGEDVDKIEVSSSQDIVFLENGSLDSTGNPIFSSNRMRTSNYLKVFSKLTELSNIDFNTYSIGFRFYDTSFKFVSATGWISSNTEVPSNATYYKIIIKKIADVDITVDSENLCLLNGYKQDKKAILYQDKTTQEWLPVPQLHEWDVVDSLENKWYKRSGKVVLNGSEVWSISSTKDKTIAFSCLAQNSKFEGVVICDKFNMNNAQFGNLEEEAIKLSASNNVIFINILKSKLETQDVEGFKKWLQANPVTVVYQLATEEVYDISPISVDAYANETMLLLSSGAINCHAEFSITSHINELVKANRSSISKLENDFYKYKVIQNRMQLNTTYNADRVTFKVDTVALASEKSKQEVDLDLFNLLMNNILVGIDNYNRIEMEAMMDFYVSIGKIDYDMWDALFLAIELQHNPPVIEIPNETPVM